MSGARTAAAAAAAGAALVAAAWLAVRSDGRALPSATLDLGATLGGADTAGYARALEPRPFVFPADHGPHPSYRNEWWYATANLRTGDGRRFGVQLTVFRSALAPEAPDSPSRWATNQAYMGHFAVSDPEGDRFRAHERFARGAAGLAGARAEPFRAWIGSWEMEGAGAGRDGSGATFPVRLRAAREGVAVELELEPLKPPVAQGRGGLSAKGPEPGNASYYYSFTRLAARGSLEIDGEAFEVEGLAWLDREWSTSVLSPGIVGWDWVALQLDDGRDLMVYRLRRADGSASAWSEGVLVEGDGTAVRLAPDAWSLEATGTWRSPVDGAVYPSGWRLRVPSRGVELEVVPLREDQELALAFRYWEGAVDVRGRGPDGPVAGAGYVELTGYAAGADRPAR